VLGPGFSITTETTYQLTTRSMSSHSTFSGYSDGPLATDAIVVGKDTWFRIIQGGATPKTTCWMHADPRAIEDATGLDLPGGGARGIPAALLVAVNATALAQPDAARLLATVDLYTAAAAFTGKLAISLGLDIHSNATAPVTIQMEGGAITGWRITLFELLRAAENAGVELPSELQGYEEADMSDANAQIVLSQAGRSVDIQLPPSSDVVELSDDQEQFAEDRKACDARIN